MHQQSKRKTPESSLSAHFYEWICVVVWCVFVHVILRFSSATLYTFASLDPKPQISTRFIWTHFICGLFVDKTCCLRGYFDTFEGCDDFRRASIRIISSNECFLTDRLVIDVQLDKYWRCPLLLPASNQSPTRVYPSLIFRHWSRPQHSNCGRMPK